MSNPHLLQLDNFLPYRLSVLTNLVSTAIAGAYRERFGLSIPAWRVLAVLANSPDLSAAEVGQRTAMDKVAVSRAVRALLREHRIEVLVCRDSGGDLTAAKLVAARELGLPVVMVDRPPAPDGVPIVATVEAAVAWLRARER